ncbi:hypothetical protein FKM82_024426 [Ascaphus truei]
MPFPAQVSPRLSEGSPVTIGSIEMGHSLLLLVTLWCLHSVCLAADVVQKPEFLLPGPGMNVTLMCEHQDSSFYYKYWYRQRKGQPLDLIGYTYSTDKPTMEEAFNVERITIHPESAQKSTLSISNVSVGDSAVYYCASSIHSERKRERDCAELGEKLLPVITLTN